MQATATKPNQRAFGAGFNAAKKVSAKPESAIATMTEPKPQQENKKTEAKKAKTNFIFGDRTHTYFSQTLGNETRYGKKNKETGEVSKIEPWNRAEMKLVKEYEGDRTEAPKKEPKPKAQKKTVAPKPAPPNKVKTTSRAGSGDGSFKVGGSTLFRSKGRAFSIDSAG
jgi:hypothetical protein